MLHWRHSGFTLCSDTSLPVSSGKAGEKKGDILSWQISRNLEDGNITPSRMEKCSVPTVLRKCIQTSNDKNTD